MATASKGAKANCPQLAVPYRHFRLATCEPLLQPMGVTHRCVIADHIVPYRRPLRFVRDGLVLLV